MIRRKGVLMASEADFPFSELEAMFDPYLEFKIEGELQAKRPDPRTTVPLDKDETDPFYRAQMLQRTLDAFVEPTSVPILAPGEIGNASLKSFVIEQTIDELNSDRWRPIFGQRLAIAAFMFTIIDRGSGGSHPYDDNVVVAGRFREFDKGTFHGQDTLVALFTNPRFIDPDAVNSKDIDHITVPVLGIGSWNYSGV